MKLISRPFLFLLCVGSSYAFLPLDHVAPNTYVEYSNTRKHSRDLVDSAQVLYENESTEKRPIRIKFITTVLDERRGISDALDQQIDFIENDVLPKAAKKWSKHLSVTPVTGDIKLQADACYGAYGSDRRVRTVSDTDLVIIVSAVNAFAADGDDGDEIQVCNPGTLAAAAACELDQFDRPVVGLMNFCLDLEETTLGQRPGELVQDAYSLLLGTSTSTFGANPAQLVDIAQHELGHILGFSSWMFKYYRNPDGSPRTARPFSPSLATCNDGSREAIIFPENTLQEYVSAEGERSYIVITPRVQQVVRNFFDCQEMEGARLHNSQGSCIGSHWHERLFFGESMSPVFVTGSDVNQNALSALTLSLMEDTGWYQVDYRGADIPEFGLGAGCDFVDSKCIQNDKVPSWGKGMFCDSPVQFDGDGQIVPDIATLSCGPDHRSWTACDLWDTSSAPFAVFESIPGIQLFSDSSLSPSFGFASSCPIPATSVGVDCTTEDDSYQPFYDVESRGADSRCVQTSYFTGAERILRPACVRTSCDAERRKVVVGEGDDEVVCDYDGQVLRLKSGSSATFECPRLASVCPELNSCPGACSGRGVCVFDGGPKCECFEDMDGVLSGDGCFPNVPEAEIDQTGLDDFASGASRWCYSLPLLVAFLVGIRSAL